MEQQVEGIVETLDALRQEHRQLDEAIDELQSMPYVDQFAIQRCKKRKLALKDMIVRLESSLIPDLDA